jgi:hypothetical protein
MRNTVAKRLRREARQEMSLDGAPARQLVASRVAVVNHPHSVRAMFLALKRAWLKPRLDTPAYVPTRLRHKARSAHRPQDLHAQSALILKPLRFIQSLFPPFATPTGGHQVHPTSALAIAWAKQGRGDKVRQLAQYFA